MQVEKQQSQSSEFILPGETASNQKISYNSNCLYQSKNGQILALKYGEAKTKEISSPQQKSQKIEHLDMIQLSYVYEPQKGDLVVGVVKMKSAQYYILDIASGQDAILGSLQFDGATKRNKPNILQGGLVYCRVTEYSKHLGCKLSCLNKGYSTKNQMGQLKGGMKILVPRFKHSVIQKKLDLISKYIKFEIAFGKNGIIWIKSQSGPHTIVLFNVINQISKGCSDQLVTQILQASKN